MSSENETVESLIANARKEIDYGDGVLLHLTGKRANEIFDRIESAWRREKKLNRNCDRFTSYKEAWKEFQKLHENDVPVVSEMLSWLFAPVAEGGES